MQKCNEGMFLSVALLLAIGLSPSAFGQQPSIKFFLSSADGNNSVTLTEGSAAVVQLWAEIGTGDPVVELDAILRGYDAGLTKSLAFEVVGFNDVVIPNSQLQRSSRGSITGLIPLASVDEYAYVGEDPTAIDSTDGVLGPRTLLLDELVIHGLSDNTTAGPDQVYFAFGSQAPGGYYMAFIPFPPPGQWSVNASTGITLGVGDASDPLQVVVLPPPLGELRLIDAGTGDSVIYVDGSQPRQITIAASLAGLQSGGMSHRYKSLENFVLDATPYSGSAPLGVDPDAFRITDRTIVATAVTNPTNLDSAIIDTAQGAASLNSVSDLDLGASVVEPCSDPCGDAGGTFATVTLAWDASLAAGIYTLCPNAEVVWVDQDDVRHSFQDRSCLTMLYDPCDCTTNDPSNPCSPLADCDSNGYQDVCDLKNSVSQDCDANGIADACQATVSCPPAAGSVETGLGPNPFFSHVGPGADFVQTGITTRSDDNCPPGSNDDECQREYSGTPQTEPFDLFIPSLPTQAVAVQAYVCWNFLADQPWPSQDIIQVNGQDVFGDLWGESPWDLCWDRDNTISFGAFVPVSLLNVGGQNLISGATSKHMGSTDRSLGEGISVVVIFDVPGNSAQNVDLFRGFVGKIPNVNTYESYLNFSEPYALDGLHFFVNALDGQDGSEQFWINDANVDASFPGVNHAWQAWIGLLAVAPTTKNGYFDHADGDATAYAVSSISVPDPTSQLHIMTDTFGGDCTGFSLAAASFAVDTIICGDGVAEGLEACDLVDLTGETCVSQGYTGGGTLGCHSSCVFDYSGCVGYVPVCGDGLVEGTEECDLADLNGADCVSEGFLSGDLACDQFCLFDYAACDGYVAGCGNAIIDPGECCEGVDLDGQTCEDLGFPGGQLACDASCGFDVSGCTPVAALDPDLVFVVGDTPKPVDLLVACAGQYKVIYDDTQIKLWDSPDMLSQILPDTAYLAPSLVVDIEPDCDVDLVEYAAIQNCWSGENGGPLLVECQFFDQESDDDVDEADYASFYRELGSPVLGTVPAEVYVEALVESVALGDIAIVVLSDREIDGTFEEVTPRPVTNVSITLGPTSGPLGTEIQVTLSPAIAPLDFNCGTRATWMEVFQPLVGDPLGPFSVSVDPEFVFESAANAAILLAGVGESNSAPDPVGMEVPGSFEGTVRFDFVQGAASKDFVFTPAEAPHHLHAIDYLDTPVAAGPPVLGAELAQIQLIRYSALPNPVPIESSLQSTTWAHAALQVKVDENATTAANAPDAILVTVLTYDTNDYLTDQRSISLAQLALDNDPDYLTYQSDLEKPIVFVDVVVDPDAYPTVSIIYNPGNGRVRFAVEDF